MYGSWKTQQRLSSATPHQVALLHLHHVTCTDHETNERPVILPLPQVQNQHLQLCLQLKYMQSVRGTRHASLWQSPSLKGRSQISSISITWNLLANLDSQPRLLPNYQSLLWGWHLKAVCVPTSPPGVILMQILQQFIESLVKRYVGVAKDSHYKQT